jgi:pilus assembly protein CpaE
MTNTGTIVWAAYDGATNRDVLETTASALGLTVQFCSPRDAAERAAEGHARVVGLEAGADQARGLTLVAEIHGRLPRASILVASRDGDLAFMRAALEAGASDVLALPLENAELHKALLRAIQATARKAAPASEAVGDVITVCGARGGLGITTLAVNLASRLAALTTGDVGLVDLDLQRGDVTTFLNLTPLNSIANFAGVQGQVDDMLLASSLTRHGNGVFVLPAPPEIEDADTVGHDEVKAALDLLRARFRYTVVDTARTITGATAAALEASRRILVVTDLSVPGIRSTRRLVDLFDRLGVPADHVDLVVTEAIPGPVSLDDAAQAIGKRPFFVVPRDETSAAEAMNHGAPLNGKPTKLAVAMTELATKVAGVQATVKPKSGPLFRRLFSRAQEVHA